MAPDRFCLFLHENYLQFFEDIEDVVAASDRFSQVDLMTTAFEHSAKMGPYAGAVACRGVVHANAHPAPSRWRPLRKPMCLDVGWQARDNCQLLARTFQVQGPDGVAPIPAAGTAASPASLLISLRGEQRPSRRPR